MTVAPSLAVTDSLAPSVSSIAYLRAYATRTPPPCPSPPPPPFLLVECAPCRKYHKYRAPGASYFPLRMLFLALATLRCRLWIGSRRNRRDARWSRRCRGARCLLPRCCQGLCTGFRFKEGRRRTAEPCVASLRPRPLSAIENPLGELCCSLSSHTLAAGNQGL